MCPRIWPIIPWGRDEPRPEIKSNPKYRVPNREEVDTIKSLGWHGQGWNPLPRSVRADTNLPPGDWVVLLRWSKAGSTPSKAQKKKQQCDSTSRSRNRTPPPPSNFRVETPAGQWTECKALYLGFMSVVRTWCSQIIFASHKMIHLPPSMAQIVVHHPIC